MENKREMKEELDFDQLDQVVGGQSQSRSTIMTCAVCKKEFDLSKAGQMTAFKEHLKICNPQTAKC